MITQEGGGIKRQWTCNSLTRNDRKVDVRSNRTNVLGLWRHGATERTDVRTHFTL